MHFNITLICFPGQIPMEIEQKIRHNIERMEEINILQSPIIHKSSLKQGWGKIPKYRSYRTEKLPKIPNFGYTVTFGTV